MFLLQQSDGFGEPSAQNQEPCAGLKIDSRLGGATAI
jgi:hypothetical protein